MTEELNDYTAENTAENIAEETPSENGEVQETEEKTKAPKGAKYYVKEVLSWIFTILAAFIIAILINSYVIRTSEVSGNSMLATLHDGQRVLISRIPCMLGKCDYGDIVVFDSEGIDRNIFVEISESLKYNAITYRLNRGGTRDKYWIKRIVGLPGDTIELRQDGLYRNGEKVDEPYVNPAEIPNYRSWTGKTWVVGEGEFFLMGDNRNHSTDSRFIGTVKQDSVLGKVVKQ